MGKITLDELRAARQERDSKKTREELIADCAEMLQLDYQEVERACELIEASEPEKAERLLNELITTRWRTKI